MKRSSSADKKRSTSPSRVKSSSSTREAKEKERQAELAARRKKIEKSGLKRDDNSKRPASNSESLRRFEQPRRIAEDESSAPLQPNKSSVHIDDDYNSSSESKFPYEITSGRLLTHYDETAGVALPLASVNNHKNMGNTVVPLVESYRSRYDRLRALLTSKLLPRREHLLQLRRQLLNTSTEVAAAKKGIERETMKDAEQIIERLRAAESMRQSAISLQVLQLEEELESIERVTRRVEQARDDTTTTGVTLTSVVPGNSSIETVRAPRASLMVELIQQFSDLSASIEKLATKPVSVQVDFPTDDFPKETSERLEVISRCDKYVHAINVKDQMLWTSLQEKKALEEKLEEERTLTYEYANEVATWADFTKNLRQELHLSQIQIESLEKRNRELEDILRRHNLYYSSVSTSDKF